MLEEMKKTLKEFQSTFTGKEDFLSDHKVLEVETLPGVAYVELARSGGELALNKPITGVRDIVWLTPIQVKGKAVDVSTRLMLDEDDVKYEIRSKGGEKERIHSQGKLLTTTLPDVSNVDLDSLKKRFEKQIDSTAAYQEFKFRGLNYGLSFQGVQELYISTTESLARISLNTNSAYVLPPGVLDSALQTCMGINFELNSQSLELPFSIKSLDIHGPLTGEIWCHARLSKNEGGLKEYDLDLFDDSGNVLVQIKGFVAVSIHGEKVKRESKTHYYESVWQAEAVGESAKTVESTDLVVLYDLSNDLTKELDSKADWRVESVQKIEPIVFFEYIKSKVVEAIQSKTRLNLTIVGESGSYTDYGFIRGLIKSASQEYPQFSGRVIGVESDIASKSTLTELLKSELHSENKEIYYQKGERLVRVLKTIQSTSEKGIDICSNGTYLITGGVGGLGLLFAKHLSKKTSGTIVLSGRSVLDSEKQALVDAIPNAVYIPSDVSDELSVNQLITKIQSEHGELKGILHGAGVLRDSFLVQKTEEEAKTVFGPKATGIQLLDEATKSIELDFLFGFSSVSAILGNVGQSDYSSANAFMDDFITKRNELEKEGKRFGKTLSVNWPLWRSGGMQIDESSEQFLKRHWGMEPLPSNDGLEAFDFTLKRNLSNTLVLHGDREKIESKIPLSTKVTNNTIQPKQQSTMDIEKVKEILIEICADFLKLSTSDMDAETELSDYGLDSILMMKLLSALEEKFDCTLDPTVVIQYPTIAELASYLLEEDMISMTEEVVDEMEVVQPKVIQNERTHSKVAIIGMSCKLPESDNIDEFWLNLKNGENLIKDVPKNRWHNSDFYNETPTDSTAYTRKGGFMKNPGFFDAEYFKVKDNEALSMDPQQRITLELTRELFANAGYKKQEVSGKNAGVFIGAKDNNYVKNGYDYLPESSHQHVIVNNISNMIAARISDFYNLKGVSQVVDTACSSSLVAIHNACEAILSGQMDMAIAGGISVMVDEYGHVGFSQAKVLSKDGKSYVFDERANGFVMGEGGGLILLKNYDQALTDGDRILGAIAASSINNDGKTMGLTVPNKDGQKAVVNEALIKSGIPADKISYYEAHGTGTLLGDPIEINAASEVYQTQTDKTSYCAIGSVKSNVGHTMTAAGVTGVMKILLQLQHRELVPTLNCEKPHPRFKFETSPFYPITTNQPWDTDHNIAAISSFGFGGTNCHLIIEESVQKTEEIKRSPLKVNELSRNYYWLGHDIVKESLLPTSSTNVEVITPEVLKTKVIQLLRERIADKLQVNAKEVLIDEGFMDLGLDSTVLIQMTTSWADELNIDLYPTLLFQYDNIEKFAGYLAQEHQEIFSKMFEQESPVRTTDSEKTIIPKKKVVRPINEGIIKEEIAIVGVTGRYPGAETLDDFWNNLVENKDSIIEIPKDRWDWKTYYGDEKKGRGKTKAKFGGFIKNIDKFDRKFFRILPLESQLMDPQHRLALEEVYHLFEDAGMAPESLKGSDTGVFMGVSSADYGSLLGKEKGLREYAQYATGNTHSVLANRISYLFDLHGPSQPIDTACSSSLIAIHRAVEAIENGNCDMAVAGGVNIIASPELSLSFSQAGMLSEDGRCKTFDQKANGYVRSEGIGMVLLKPLSQAQKDGDQIYAIVKGSAENHGGKVNTLTSPNPNAQRDLLVRAYQKAGINPADIGYIEAHGTGTPLGDPIETDALKMAFDQLDQSGVMKLEQCGVGSVKSNIGHLEAAAGIAGITKALLCLKHQKLTGNPHLTEPNHLLKLENSPIRLIQKTEDWISNSDKPRIAGVSSFGFGGANAHIILEEYKPEKLEDKIAETVLICLSAKNEGQLKQKQNDLLTYLDNNPDVSLSDIAYTLQIGRDAMSHRAVLVTSSIAELVSELRTQIQTETSKFISKQVPSGVENAPVDNEIVEKKDWNKIAEFWLEGNSVDWKQAYRSNERRKISLPGYPFAKTRCWYDDLAETVSEAKDINTKVIAPELEEHQIGDEVDTENLGDGIVLVRMQAQSTKNMLNEQLIKSLEKTFAQLEKRNDLKVVILTGYDNVFCMGGSQDVLAGIADNKQKYTDAPFVYKGLLEFKVPVITAMQGIAVGGGLVFGLYGDLVFMSEKATYSSNFMKYGFTPGMGATYIMPQKFGHQLAQEMMYSAKLIGGAELKERGASVKITSDVMKEAIRAAKELAAKPRVALEVLKRKLAGKTLSELDEHVREELEMHDKTFHTEEVKALIASHFEKKETTGIVVDAPRVIDGKVTLIDPVSMVNQANAPFDVNYIKKVKLSPVNEHKSTVITPNTIAQKKVQKVVEREVVTQSIPMNQEDPVQLIKKSISGILHLPENELNVEETFLDLGIDSISGVELIRTVNEKFDLQLETVILYDYPTIQQLAGHISAKIPAKTIVVQESIPQEIVPVESVKETITNEVTGTDTSDLISILKSVFERVLNLPADEIDPQEAFIEFGVDSISGVEVVRGINEQFDLSLEAVILYDYFNLEKLAAFISEQSSGWKPAVKKTVEKIPIPVPVPVEKKPVIEKSMVHAEATEKKIEYRAEDIAIIGMSGRFPKASNTEEFWQNLANGVNAVEEVPKRKWSTDELYSPIKGESGKSYGKWMGAIDDEDKFDAYFFNISPLEAKKMDPQQRIFLEEVWKTFEDAGYAGKQLAGSSCGVYVGVGQGDYFDRFKRNDLLDNHVLTGVTTSMLAARISYLLNLQGPAIAVDTACSSSLVAIHQACQSIRSGDCEMAIAGGVNVMTTESMHIMTSKAEMLSDDGKCHTFDTKANGFVPGEAVSAILLKPIAKAIEDGDHIHAVIKGSGSNQDGKTNGIMAPSANSQARLMSHVYEKFSIDTKSISLIEAHGTGTKLGDPIEIKALKEVYGISDEKSCALGSVKTNIGHGLTAAGISGLTKLILALKAEQIPPSLNYENCNEHINLDGSPFFVNTSLKSWSSVNGQPRRAAISSFGYSGTNAHIVLEEYKSEASISPMDQENVFVFSAKNEERLTEKVKEFKAFLIDPDDLNLNDVAATLFYGRESMIERLAVVARSKDDLMNQLEAYLLRQSGNYAQSNIRKKGEGNSDQLSVSVVLKEQVNNWLSGNNDSTVDFASKKYQKVSLPTYPFEKERFWADRMDIQSVPLSKSNGANEWSVTKTIHPAEALLQDHQVNGRKIVPGVMYLDWVKEAIHNEHNIHVNQFNGLKLISPVYVDINSVDLQLKITKSDDTFSYEIAAKVNENWKVNAHGKCSLNQEAFDENINLEQLQNHFYKEISEEEVYRTFNELGLQYGRLFNGIRTLKYSNKEALGIIELSHDLSKEAQMGLLDSCLQVCLGINISNPQLRLPYSIDEMFIDGPLPKKVWSHVQKELMTNGNTAYSVKLYSETGQCIGRFKSVIVLPILAKTFQKITGESKYLYVPKWKRIKSTAKSDISLTGTHLILGGSADAEFTESLRTHLKQKGADVLELDVLNELPAGVQHVYLLNGLLRNSNQFESIESMEYRVFRSIKKLQDSKFNQRGAELTVFTCNTQKVTANDKINPNGSGIVGTIGSLAKEQPTWKIRMIDLDCQSEVNNWDALFTQSYNKNGAVVAYRNNFLFQSELLPWDAEKTIVSKLKENGVYVLLGGAGGIGRVTSKYLIERYNAKVIWLGRRTKDAQMEAYIEEASNGNNRPDYIQCDATKAQELSQAYQHIKTKYGQVNGIFHSAIVLNDRLIKNMDEQAFRIAFEPKSVATHNLFEAFKEEALDFVCFYSSIQSQVNAPGQSNYAAGCTYKDSYAHALQQQRKNTNIYTINWGYWGEVGVVASKEYNEKLAASGLGSINATEGMEILEHVLAGEQKQLAAIKFINS